MPKQPVCLVPVTSVPDMQVRLAVRLQNHTSGSLRQFFRAFVPVSPTLPVALFVKVNRPQEPTWTCEHYRWGDWQRKHVTSLSLEVLTLFPQLSET